MNVANCLLPKWSGFVGCFSWLVGHLDFTLLCSGHGFTVQNYYRGRNTSHEHMVSYFAVKPWTSLDYEKPWDGLIYGHNSLMCAGTSVVTSPLLAFPFAFPSPEAIFLVRYKIAFLTVDIVLLGRAWLFGEAIGCSWPISHIFCDVWAWKGAPPSICGWSSHLLSGYWLFLAIHLFGIINIWLWHSY